MFTRCLHFVNDDLSTVLLAKVLNGLMPFERMPGKRTRVIAVRLTDEEMELVQQFGDRLASESPSGGALSASDIIREALRCLGDRLAITSTKQKPAAAAKRKK